jgi:hypothetical protein
MDWKTLEPLFITALIGLMGWSLLEISNLRVNTGKIQTELVYMKEDLSEIKEDIGHIRNETAQLKNNPEIYATK